MQPDAEHPETPGLGVPGDTHGLIVDAAIDLFGRAEVADFLEFLTPTRLAAASSGDGREAVSVGSIRHHFRGPGGTFDRRLLIKEVCFRFVFRSLDSSRLLQTASLRTCLSSMLALVSGEDADERLGLERLWMLWLVTCDQEASSRRLMRRVEENVAEMTLRVLEAHVSEVSQLLWLQTNLAKPSPPEVAMSHVLSLLRTGHLVMTQGGDEDVRARGAEILDTILYELTRCSDTKKTPWLPTGLSQRDLAPAIYSYQERGRSDGDRTRARITDLALHQLGHATAEDLLSFLTPGVLARKAQHLKAQRGLAGFPSITPALVSHYFHHEGTVRRFDRVQVLEAAFDRIHAAIPDQERPSPAIHEGPDEFQARVLQQLGPQPKGEMPEDRERRVSTMAWMAFAVLLPGATEDHLSELRERVAILVELINGTPLSWMSANGWSEIEADEPDRVLDQFAGHILGQGKVAWLRSQRTVPAMDSVRFTVYLTHVDEVPQPLRLPPKRGVEPEFQCGSCGRRADAHQLALELEGKCLCVTCIGGCIDAIMQNRLRTQAPREPKETDTDCMVCGRSSRHFYIVFEVPGMDGTVCETCLLDLAGLPDL